LLINGLDIDDYGKPQCKDGIKKDDITTFLENYSYTEYDIILNIADLMATSENILEPIDRLEDIKKRRTIDPTNRVYFLIELINMLNKFLYDSKFITNYNHLELDKNMFIQQVEEVLKAVSKLFFHFYLNINLNKQKNY